MKKWMRKCSVVLLALSMLFSLCCQALPGFAAGSSVEVRVWEGSEQSKLKIKPEFNGSGFAPDGVFFQAVLKALHECDRDIFKSNVTIGDSFVDGAWGDNSEKVYKAAFGSGTPSFEEVGRQLWSENEKTDAEPLEIEKEWPIVSHDIIMSFGFSKNAISESELSEIKSKCEDAENEYALNYIAGAEFGNAERANKPHGYLAVLGNRLHAKADDEIYDMLYVFLAFTRNGGVNRMVYVIKLPDAGEEEEHDAPVVYELTDRNMWLEDAEGNQVRLQKAASDFEPVKFWFVLDDAQPDNSEFDKTYSVELSAQGVETASFELEGNAQKTDKIDIAKLVPFFGKKTTVSILDGDEEIAHGDNLRIPALKEPDQVPAGSIPAPAGLGAEETHKVSYAYKGNIPEGAVAVLPKDNGEYKQGDTVSVKDEPSLTGYSFGGWETSDVTVKDGKFTMPNNDVRFYGEWRPETSMPAGSSPEPADLGAEETHKVSYAYKGNIPEGAVAVLPKDNGEYKQGDTVSVKDEPSLTGYSFSGWETNDVKVKDGKFTMPDDDVRFYGEWTVNEYTVSYEYEEPIPEGAPEPPQPEKHNYGETVVPFKPTAIEGYTFHGWETDADDIEYNEAGNFKIPAHDVKFTGKWSVNVHKVRYDYTGSAPNDVPEYPEPAEYSYGDSVTVAQDPEMVGYTFSGWKAENIKVEDGMFTMPDEDVQFIGEWTVNKHKVRYEYVGDVRPMDASAEPEEMTYDFGSSVRVQANPSLENYTFSGWSAENITPNENGMFAMPDEDVVFTGSWSMNTYTLTYTYDESAPEGVAVPEAADHVPNETVTLAEVEPVVGYEFVGWMVDGDVIENGGTFTMPNHDVTVIGSWVRLYSVTYIYDGIVPEGALALPETEYHEEGYSVEVVVVPEIEGYDFSGWSSGDFPYIGTFEMPSNDVTLHGSWTVRKHKISFRFEGDVPEGVEILDKEYNYHASVELPTPKRVEGYTFNGWNPVEGVEVENNRFIMPDRDLVFTGIWAINSHTVRYEFKGDVPEIRQDTLPEAHTYIYGETVSLADEPVRVPAYQFGGWVVKGVTMNEDGTFTMPDRDVTIEGVWTRDGSRGGRIALWLILLLLFTGGFVAATIAKPRKKTYTPGVSLFSDASIKSIRSTQDRDREGETTIRRR